MKHISFILFLLFTVSALATSCKVRTPNGILSESKMEQFLYDYHQAQALAENNDSANYKLRQYTDAVLAKYGMSRTDFDRNMKWYARHADVLYDIYEKINLRLDNESQVFGAASNRKETIGYTNISSTGDTANIWYGVRGVTLIPKPGKNLFSFHFDSDSTYKPRDKFEWHFDSQFFYQSGKKNAVAVMAVRYENDSLTSVQQQVYGNADNRISLNAVNLPIKSIEGFVYLEEPLNTPAKLLFLSKFTLIRIHDLSKRDSVTVAKTDSIAVNSNDSTKHFIDSIQSTANGTQEGDHFRSVTTRKRAMPHEKLLPR